MSDTKIFTFPDGGTSGGGNMLGFLAPLLQQRGLDPNMVFAMMNNGRNGFGGEGGWFLWVIFLFFLMGWGGNGWGGLGGNRGGQSAADLGNLINNDAGRELLMSAIQGNGNAIGQLATTLHCDVNAIQTAIGGLQTQLCNIGSQIGLSGQQIINAVQAGNCQIASQIASCCCDVRNAITTQGYENQLRTVQQTGEIVQNATNNTNVLAAKLDAQTQLITDRFCQLEMREMANTIQQLRDERTAYQMSALSQQQTQNIINTLRPCPVPAYITCNPFGCNGGLNDGYPYGYNGGCNNGCGGC